MRGQFLFFSVRLCGNDDVMGSAFERRLVLIRHAHRDTSMGSGADNGLSEKGLAQAGVLATRLTKKYAEKQSLSKLVLLSSPKMRCLQTLAPFAEEHGIQTVVLELLGEGPDVEGRADAFLEHWRRTRDACTIVCSHGDFLPVLTGKLIGTEVGFEKGQMAELRFKLF